MTDDAAGTDITLTPAFQSDWRRRIERMCDGERARLQLAMPVGADPTEMQLEAREDRFVARYGGREIGAWPSRAAFLADIALYPTIEEWLSAWSDLDGEERAELLARLRRSSSAVPVVRANSGPKKRETGEATMLRCRSRAGAVGR